MRTAEPELQSYWNWKAAANFIAGGAGAGLLVFAALATNGPARPWLILCAAIALVGLGLFFVLLEVGHPYRLLNVIWRPQTSWMSREALVAGATIAAGAAAIWFESSEMAMLAGLLALALLYCHARLLNAAKGVPAWREPAIVPLIFVTGLVEGGGLFVALAAAMAAVRFSAIVLLGALLIVRWQAWRAYRARLGVAGAAPVKAVAVIERINRPLGLAGHVLPLVLLTAGAITPSRVGIGIVATGAFLAAAAGSYLKYTLITRASYTQGFAIPRSPARSPGFSRPGVRPGWS